MHRIVSFVRRHRDVMIVSLDGLHGLLVRMTIVSSNSSKRRRLGSACRTLWQWLRSISATTLLS